MQQSRLVRPELTGLCRLGKFPLQCWAVKLRQSGQFVANQLESASPGGHLEEGLLPKVGLH